MMDALGGYAILPEGHLRAFTAVQKKVMVPDLHKLGTRVAAVGRDGSTAAEDGHCESHMVKIIKRNNRQVNPSVIFEEPKI